MDCHSCPNKEAQVAVAPVEHGRGVVDSTEFVCAQCAWNLIKHAGYREVPFNTDQDATTIKSNAITRIGNEDGELRSDSPKNLSERE